MDSWRAVFRSDTAVVPMTCLAAGRQCVVVAVNDRGRQGEWAAFTSP